MSEKLNKNCYGFIGEKIKDVYCEVFGLKREELNVDTENLISAFGFMLVNEKFDFATKQMFENEARKVVDYTKTFTESTIKRVIAKKEKEIAELKGELKQ